MQWDNPGALWRTTAVLNVWHPRRTWDIRLIWGNVESEVRNKIGDNSDLFLYGVIYSVKNIELEADVLNQV
jgi:hypothetical protein